eukprot:CAMPEP_0119334200 /NCGR_PEP_ID=MMETSP1333-20130426/86810_1 /TAXON_ID=418940 /ORGANISM="Scyphosphaera apsteinii, Strain RCC1455" /LENGTH=98 /DNA_ID=CAMNT_0007344445 /DNA_START=105 /DNA_END=398 /DNA_ORIENTATION=+
MTFHWRRPMYSLVGACRSTARRALICCSSAVILGQVCPAAIADKADERPVPPRDLLHRSRGFLRSDLQGLINPDDCTYAEVPSGTVLYGLITKYVSQS